MLRRVFYNVRICSNFKQIRLFVAQAAEELEDSKTDYLPKTQQGNFHTVFRLQKVCFKLDNTEEHEILAPQNFTVMQNYYRVHKKFQQPPLVLQDCIVKSKITTAVIIYIRVFQHFVRVVQFASRGKNDVYKLNE
eukprot:TRINITY_DN4726_c2_g1_i1.p1 TRINITY_DN4726_c2_g1~~TRINITY_DN4726_c2_g1_i1.p1  ORF type:complete len:135 (+),score=3.85 TRINITY_DN4726_c2_g1_i1:128-532(+)